MITLHTCRICGASAEFLTPYEGAWFCPECLGEHETFQEEEQLWESEMLVHRKTHKKFYNDLAYELEPEKHIIKVQKPQGD